MDIENKEAHRAIPKGESKLKDLIVDYVGEISNPENDEVTVENIIEVIANEFPEFLFVIAEENWISGYTQALSDVEFVNMQNKEKKDEPNITDRIYEEGN